MFTVTARAYRDATWIFNTAIDLAKTPSGKFRSLVGSPPTRKICLDKTLSVCSPSAVGWWNVHRQTRPTDSD